MRHTKIALIASVLLWNATQAFAAPGDTIGSAIRIVSLVTAEFEADERQLATGDSVRQDELIEVSTDGSGELRLRDDTKLALGPGSQLLLDEFVYNPEISGGAIVLNLVKGTFRFITGIAAKPAYVIRTPTASITVRGTIFDVYVQDSGMSWLLLLEGAIEVCNERGECRFHDEPGKLIRISPEGALGNPVKWASLPEKQDEPFGSAFPFIVAAPLIDPEPIFTPDDIVLGKLPDTPAHEEETKPEKKPKKKVKKRRKKKKVNSARRKRKSKTHASSNMPKFSITIGVGGGMGRRPKRHHNKRHRKPKY